MTQSCKGPLLAELPQGDGRAEAEMDHRLQFLSLQKATVVEKQSLVLEAGKLIALGTSSVLPTLFHPPLPPTIIFFSFTNIY